MLLFRFAWRNIWRHPKRTILTSLALALTTFLLVFLLAFQVGTYDTMKQQSLRLLDGYAQWQQPDYLEKPTLSRHFALSPDLVSDLTQLQQHYPQLHWAAKAEAYGLLSFGEHNMAGMLLAVDPLREPTLTRLQDKIQQGRYLQPSDQNQILLGQTLAQRLGIELGEMLAVLSTDVNGSVVADFWQVVGMFDSGLEPMDRQLVVVPLAYFQSLFAMEQAVHKVAFLMPHLSQIEAIEPELQALAQRHQLVLRDGRDLQPGLYNGIDLDFFSAMIWYLALLLIVLLIVVNTLLMSLLEREREFGLLLSLGVSPAQLWGLVALETQWVLGIGLTLGSLLGVGLSLYFMQTGITIPGTEEIYAEFGLEATLYPALTMFAVGFAPLVLWSGITLLNSLLSLRLLRLKPLADRG